MQIDREMKKFVNSSVSVTQSSIAIVVLTVGIHESSKWYFFSLIFAAMFFLRMKFNKMVKIRKLTLHSVSIVFIQ